MNKPLMKNMLLGFLPLLLFVLADEFLSSHYPEEQATRYALVLALVFGIGQALWIFIREKRLDRMVLLDTGLILLLGGVSLFSGNEIFFKLKPALVQFVIVIFLGVMAFFKPELLQEMGRRFQPNQQFPETQLRAMQRSAQGLTALFFLHTLLIVYSALYMSKAAWAFISGPLIYILAALYFFGLLIIGKIRARRSS